MANANTLTASSPEYNIFKISSVSFTYSSYNTEVDLMTRPDPDEWRVSLGLTSGRSLSIMN